MNSLMLTPEMAKEHLPDCKPGEEKQILVTIKVNSVDEEEGLQAEITEVGYAEEPEETEEETMEEEEIVDEVKTKRPAAVVAVLAKK